MPTTSNSTTKAAVGPNAHKDMAWHLFQPSYVLQMLQSYPRYPEDSLEGEQLSSELVIKTRPYRDSECSCYSILVASRDIMYKCNVVNGS